MEFLTPEIFNALIIANLMVGIALAGVRLYQDLTRSSSRSHSPKDKTQPKKPR